MKGKLLCDAGLIEQGAVVEISSKIGVNNNRTAADAGGQSTSDAPVYAVSDEDGHAEEVDTRDIVATV